MQELLDDQQVGQEEKAIPKLIYGLASSYVGFWIAIIIVEFTLLDVLFFDMFAVFCVLMTGVLGIGILLTWQEEWGQELKGYLVGMVGTELCLVVSFIAAFGWQMTIGRRAFDVLLLLAVGTAGLFLVGYYQQRQQAAAWWIWLKQCIYWYWLLHLDVLVQVFVELPFVEQPIWRSLQLVLLWMGAGVLLQKAWKQYSPLERQVGRLLFISLGVILTIKKVRVHNNTSLELLLIGGIILLVLAVSKAQIVYSKTEEHE